MKIAFIVGEFPSISQTFILNQITGLIDLEYHVDIFAFSACNMNKLHEDIANYNLLSHTYYIDTYIAKMPKNRFLRFLKCLYYLLIYSIKNPLPTIRSLNLIKYGGNATSLNLFLRMIPFLDRGPYDVIHSHFGPLGNLAISLREIGAIKGKIITSFHGYDLTSYLEKSRRTIYTKLFKKGDLFLPISDHWKDLLIKLGCPKHKIIVHHMGINLNDFKYVKKNSRNGKKIRILTIARLVEKKGVQYGIRAVANLIKSYPNIHYTIAGDGPLKNDLTNLIKNLDATEYIQVLGWKNQAEILGLICKSDILLTPSITAKTGDQEGIPVVIMEAFGLGIPVVSTYHSGIPELVKDGVSGFLVSERDSEALSNRLSLLIENAEIRGNMGYNGRNYIEEFFDVNKLNIRLSQLYKQLLS